jgi:DNA-binding transcriptional LysR family regulator
MDKLQSMRVFAKVAREGSFTGAARALDASTAYASRRVANLEKTLNTSLLRRSTKSVTLTPVGVQYLRRCEEILSVVDQAEGEVAGQRLQGRGRISVHAATGIGQHYVVPILTNYQRKFSDIQINLTLSQSLPNPLEEGYDVIFTLVDRTQESPFATEQLGHVYGVLCASQTYLRKYGTPQSLDALRGHTCLEMMTSLTPRDVWTFDGPNGVEDVKLMQSRFRINAVGALTAAVRADMGIALLPAFAATEGLKNGNMIRVLPR